MDLKGSLVDTHLKIYPSEGLIDFIQTISVENDVPENIARLFKNLNKKDSLPIKKKQKGKENIIKFSDKDIENLNRIKEEVQKIKAVEKEPETPEESNKNVAKDASVSSPDVTSSEENSKTSETPADASSLNSVNEIPSEREGPFLYTSDVVWIYTYLEKQRKEKKSVPYLHELLERTEIEPPKNSVLKRNPILEARCVKLRSQQEAREYRKMTKSVDNVRLRFPDDSISYQLKQINRQLIAIGQFIISIFAGFLFGFKGVEWMIGPLDFGFKLLLGVMCALIIALAEIYFLAKKLNEELSVPETVQLGGPPKFVDSKTYSFEPRANIEAVVGNKEKLDIGSKEHQD